MKGSFKQALSIGLMATIIWPASLPAFSQAEKPVPSSTSSVETKLTTSTSSAPGTATTSSSTTVTTTTTTTTTTSSNSSTTAASKPLQGPYQEVDERMVNIEHRIVDGLSSGRLTAERAANLRKGLDAVLDVEAQYRAEPSKFTHWELVRLHSLLDKLSSQIESNLGDRDLASTDFEFTRQDLLKRIDLAALHGRLTSSEVAEAKQRFNRIVSLEHLMRKERGRLTYADKLMLSIDYDHLAQWVRRQMGERSLTLPEVEKASVNVEIKIDEAVKAGKLSESRAQELRKTLNELKAAEKELEKNGRSGERDQIILLGAGTEAVANAVARALNPAPSPSVRLAALDSRIANALDGGQLNPMEALELKEDLDALLSVYMNLGTANDTNAERLSSLNVDIARLESRLDRHMHGPSRVWPGMTVLITHLSLRSKMALDAKRMTDDEAKSFRQDLSKLSAKKLEFEKSQGGIKTGQALELSEDVQRMAARLEKTMKDREMVVPNTDSLSTAINNRIAEATMSGDISAGDARSAVLRLGEINSVKERYRASDTTLSNREVFNLAFELERLSTNIEEIVHRHQADFPGVDTRRAQIEALIEEGISSGRLNTAEAVLLKTGLDESIKLERQYRQDPLGLTAEKALELITSLEGEWRDLDRQLREQAVLNTDLVSLQGNVEKKMRQGFSYGLLTHAEVETLRDGYDAVVSALHKWRSTDGGLSYGERLAFAYGFQRLTAAVERQMREMPINAPAIDLQRNASEQRLGALLASGRIPVQEAQDIKGLLDEVVMSSWMKRRSGGGMSYQESIVVSLDLDRLNQRIERRAAALKSPLPDIDARQSALEKDVNSAISSGAISAEQGRSLLSELERVASAEAAFRISDESLNFAEAVNLVLDLERIKTRLNAAASRKTPAAGSSQKKVSSKASSTVGAAKPDSSKTKTVNSSKSSKTK